MTHKIEASELNGFENRILHQNAINKCIKDILKYMYYLNFMRAVPQRLMIRPVNKFKNGKDSNFHHY